MENLFEKPLVTVDIIIFTVVDSDLKVLLIRRGVAPFKDMWAIPGGFVRSDETLEEAASRELVEETGAKDIYLEQLYTFGNPKRDPRGRVITIAYFALINSENIKLHATTDASEAKWFSIYDLPQLAFDHKDILDYALKRLRWKLEYTAIVFQLLPKRFTLAQLQKIYEITFHKKFDKRNFRKKILILNILKEAGAQKIVKHRPAKLYSFKGKIERIIEIF